jgi:SPP1 family predicted phage head-tail adaptor
MLRGLSSRVPLGGRMAGPGEMNRQVTFASPAARASDGTGGTGYTAAFSCWAAIYALAGIELDKPQQIAQKVTHLVVINYRLGIQENMQIQYIDGGVTRTFQIVTIDDPDEQKWQLKILCFEMGQNAGGSN